MPQLPIADKTTLDTVNGNIGATADVANASGSIFARLAEILTNRLTATRAAYLDYINNLNVRLTDARAGKLDLIGSTNDAAGQTTMFAFFKRLEAFVDTLETKVQDVPYGARQRGIIASSTLRFSADTERQVVGTTYTKTKEIGVLQPGTCRVSFAIRTLSSWSGNERGQIYVDGVPVGTERSATSTLTTYTEDITLAKFPSLIQLYATGGTYDVYVSNFRVSFDLSTTDPPMGGVITN